MPPSDPGSGAARRWAAEAHRARSLPMHSPHPPSTRDLSVLTGVRASKPIFYAEYRHTSKNLDRTLHSLGRVAEVLVSTGDGAEPLCQAVVERAADQLGASWAVLALRPKAMPDASIRLMARDPEGAILLDLRQLPADIRRRVQRALVTVPPVQPGATEVFMRLEIDDALQGVLGALQDEADPGGLQLEDADVCVLSILARHAMMALRSDAAMRRGRQLLARAEKLYEQADARARSLAERNRELHETRKNLGLAQKRQLIDDERRRLARDLHDSVIQQVLGAGMAIDLCRSELPSRSPANAQLEYAKQLIRAAVEQLRSSIETLSDPQGNAEEDLAGMLRDLQTSHTAKNFDIALHVTGNAVSLTATAKRSLFRIASECLFNAVTHASGQRAVIRLEYGPDLLRLSVADDGNGRPQVLRKILRGEVPGTGGGYHRGLTDMDARVAELGGTLKVVRSHLGGIKTQVEIPLTLVMDHDDEMQPGGSDG